MAVDLARAQQLLSLRRPAEAESVLRHLLADAPDAAPVLQLLTLAVLDQDRNTEAEDLAHRAVAADPADEQGYRLVAVASIRTGNIDQARSAAQVAVNIQPQIWQTHYTLGQALLAGRLPRTRDALACANEAVGLAPHVSEPHNLAGLCLDGLRMHAEAQRAFAEALRLDPTSASAMGNLSSSHLQDGKLANASSILTSALSTAPQSKQLHGTYDALLYRLLLRLSTALLALAVVLYALSVNNLPLLVRVAALGVGLALCGSVTSRILSRLPRGVRHWVRGLVRRGTVVQGIVVAAFVLLFAGTIAIGLAPGNAADSVVTTVISGLEILAVALFVGGGIDWLVASRRLKRANREVGR